MEFGGNHSNPTEERKCPSGKQVAPVRRNVDTGGQQLQEVNMRPVSTLYTLCCTLCWTLHSGHLLFVYAFLPSLIPPFVTSFLSF